jgi:NADP-dependent 3-hydroxy acid dehydrogenase YdfG
MVKFSTITQANARFAANNASNTGLVLVFSGATSGIGSGILENIATMIHSSTIYILGCSISKFIPQRSKLEELNRTLKLVFLEAEVSLIGDMDAVCKTIKETETRVDYLCMSQGCFSNGVPNCMLYFSSSFPLHRILC